MEKNCWIHNHFTHVYQTLQSHEVGSWDTEWERQIFLSPRAIFYQITPLTTQKIKLLKKCLEISFYTSVPQMAMYGSSDMECNWHNFLSFWAIFCSLNQNFEKIKLLVISLFYTCVPQLMIICYNVPETWWLTDVIFIFQVGLFFALLPPISPNSPKNQSLKKWKKHPKIS